MNQENLKISKEQILDKLQKLLDDTELEAKITDIKVYDKPLLLQWINELKTTKAQKGYKKLFSGLEDHITPYYCVLGVFAHMQGISNENMVEILSIEELIEKRHLKNVKSVPIGIFCNTDVNEIETIMAHLNDNTTLTFAELADVLQLMLDYTEM